MAGIVRALVVLMAVLLFTALWLVLSMRSFRKKGGSEVNVDSDPQRCGWCCRCVGGVNGGVVIAAMALVALVAAMLV